MSITNVSEIVSLALVHGAGPTLHLTTYDVVHQSEVITVS